MKRCLDLLCVFCLLPAALPVLAACMVLIRLDSKGPILFRQTRMGRGFRPFRIFKLRTMAHRAAGSAYTLGADPRITPAGQWMRRYKLDELPQLWNVLLGEMSMVGPRPVLPELTHEFRGHYERLLTVRPGLTDPAALKYRYETDLLAAVPDPLLHFKTVVTPDKIQLSTAYLRRATVWTDLAVMARTARVLVPRFPVPRIPVPRFARSPRPTPPIAAVREHFIARSEGQSL
ncbi:MAG TPA: sugar transferase [Terracidiphilus sp.]|jgi:lipopolysaccharide/colanic/teichoic acid biosynthesis glycosyltransferase|nr:sugar transferase [Terracidiphilus sp.]